MSIYVRTFEHAALIVENKLGQISESTRELGLPKIMGIVRASGTLLRQGVTFLVKIKDPDSGVSDDVPLRVESPSVVQYRFCTSEMLAYWKRRPIHKVPAEWCMDENTLTRKLCICLRTAWNYLRRRLQHLAHIAKIKTAKQERREKKKNEIHPARSLLDVSLAWY